MKDKLSDADREKEQEQKGNLKRIKELEKRESDLDYENEVQR